MTSDAIRYHTGLAAEEAAERIYAAQGASTLARRARTQSGEIDLIVELAGEVIFVEVKARRTAATAAASLSQRQQARIFAAAELWLAETGRSPLTPCRFDVVTVDATGRAEVIENAFGAA